MEILWSGSFMGGDLSIIIYPEDMGEEIDTLPVYYILRTHSEELTGHIVASSKENLVENILAAIEKCYLAELQKDKNSYVETGMYLH